MFNAFYLHNLTNLSSHSIIISISRRLLRGKSTNKKGVVTMLLEVFCILFGFLGMLIGGEYAEDKLQPATGPQAFACLGYCILGAALGVGLVLLGAWIHPWICLIR